MTAQDKTLLFDFGIEGGGARVYRFKDNAVVEEGSSGGVLDEDEDPFQKWERKYDNWEVWWDQFRKRNSEWIQFYPRFIHPEIRSLIKKEVDAFQGEITIIPDPKLGWYAALSADEDGRHRFSFTYE